MSGRFTAHHNPAVVGLRASNLSLMLIGYSERGNYGTRYEMWADALITRTELQLEALIEGDWQPIRWFEITEFVPWISQIKEQGKKDEEKITAIRKNWLLLYPGKQIYQLSSDAKDAFPTTIPTPLTPHTADAELRDPRKEPTTKRLEELSNVIFGQHFKMNPIPNTRMMLELRDMRIWMPERNIFLLPKLMEFMIETKQHPDFTHPGRKKGFVNMRPLAARTISFLPGYEDYFEEKDFGEFGTELGKLEPVDPESWKSERYKELDRLTQRINKRWV